MDRGAKPAKESKERPLWRIVCCLTLSTMLILTAEQARAQMAQLADNGMGACAGEVGP